MAHLTRTLELAAGLAPQAEKIIAAYEVPEILKSSLSSFRFIQLKHGLSGDAFNQAIQSGRMPYDEKLVQNYVNEDLDLIQKIKPDAVVGDFRLSLAISRQLVPFKYFNLVNAIWWPQKKKNLPFPSFPGSRFISSHFLQKGFEIIEPWALKRWHKVFNRVASSRQVTGFSTFLDLYCTGDEIILPDLPSFFEAPSWPSHCHFIGPILFSLKGALPQLDASGPPRVYVSLGSSGDARLIPLVAEVLSELPVRAIVSTSARGKALQNYKNVEFYSFLPAREVLQHSQLIICNGGAPSNYLALSQGVPILAIASNMDQHLNARMIETKGLGLHLRSEKVSKRVLKKHIQELLTTTYREKAQQISQEIKKWDAVTNFNKIIQEEFS